MFTSLIASSTTTTMTTLPKPAERVGLERRARDGRIRRALGDQYYKTFLAETKS